MQINERTAFWPADDEGWLPWRTHHRARCAYDPENARDTRTPDGHAHLPADSETDDQLLKAADTYRTLEAVARENSFPQLQSKMFVRRQDVQRRRYRVNEQYLEWAFAQVSRGLFKYGESLGRILAWSLVIIGSFASLYLGFGLIEVTGANAELSGLVDALYFSTLTFTTLGFGNFQPATTLGRGLVTLQAATGAIMIATVVFVLGRRAAR
ncbi:potassium channel family protein [Halosimplex carlsbadense]|uniref:potassium channel family protein n=1 Tax=Halosimplex carlsbadense TaxID=171164 RepID=UPI001F1AE859|nr:potassium channel family protein [Halosimplex carlsbadense]